MLVRQQLQVDRRPGARPGRRSALAVALAIGLLASSATAATADAGSDQLVVASVYAPGGVSSDSVSLAALQSDPQRCQPYAGQDMNELGRQGPVDLSLASSGPQSGTGALATILHRLQTPVALGGVTTVTVVNADGSPQVGPNSQLTPADLASPSDFANPVQSPVVQADGSVNQYDRPSRGSEEGQPDEDFLDEVQESQDGLPLPVAIEVFEGPPLTVSASASQTTVPAGATVSFTAEVSPPDQSGLSFDWSFDGGGRTRRRHGQADRGRTRRPLGPNAERLACRERRAASGGRLRWRAQLGQLAPTVVQHPGRCARAVRPRRRGRQAVAGGAPGVTRDPSRNSVASCGSIATRCRPPDQ